jgi:hypothetical protein
MATARCDVLAIGRCSTCGNAFCSSDRMVSSVTQYVDLRAACSLAFEVARR